MTVRMNQMLINFACVWSWISSLFFFSGLCIVLLSSEVCPVFYYSTGSNTYVGPDLLQVIAVSLLCLSVC